MTMETIWHQSRNISDNVAYAKKVCMPQCGLLKDYPGYSDLLYTVASLDNLESNVKEIIVNNLEPGEDICQIIASPIQGVLRDSRLKHPERIEQQTDMWNYDWVFVLQKEHMLLFDTVHTTDKPNIRKAPIKSLLSIEWGIVLLHSWVNWSWLDKNHIEHASFDFNGTGAPPIEELIAYLYQSNYSSGRKLRHQIIGMDENLKSFPWKFVERIPLLVTPQERILAAEYHPFHPPTWQSWHGLFRKLERRAIPASALIMTDRQLIIAQEEEHDGGLGLGTIIRTVKLDAIKTVITESNFEGTQFIIVVGNENVEERIFVNAPEKSYQEIYESFRSYVTSRGHFLGGQYDSKDFNGNL